MFNPLNIIFAEPIKLDVVVTTLFNSESVIFTFAFDIGYPVKISWIYIYPTTKDVLVGFVFNFTLTGLFLIDYSVQQLKSVILEKSANSVLFENSNLILFYPPCT